MNTLLNSMEKLVKFGAFLSGFFIVALVLLILAEIFLRSFFDYSTMIADEYSGYFYLASIFFALAYTFLKDKHIRINILTSKLSKKSNRKIDIFASFIALLLLIFILIRTILFTYDSYSLEMLSENVSETPLYIPQLVMPFGIVLFIFACILVMLKGFLNDK